MKLIAETFNKRFSGWKITLPEEDLNVRCSGYINKEAGLFSIALEKAKLVHAIIYWQSDES